MCVAAFLAAFSVRAVLLSPDIALWFKLIWVLLLGIGVVRARWGALLLLTIVPWLPWLPALDRGHTIPFGLIHLLVASQALPLLIQVALGRTRIEGDEPTWSWTLLGALALASLTVNYAAYRLIFDSSAAFWSEMAAQAGRYAFERPGLEQENMIVASTTLIDGLLVYLLLRATWDARGLRTLVPAVGLGGLGVALFAFYQYQTRTGLVGDWLVNDPLITRVNATYTDPNALAAYFALVIPTTLGLAGAATGARRLLWGLAAATMFGGLIMTAGRAGMLALLVGIAVLGAGVIALKLDTVDPWPPVRAWFRRGYLTVAVLAIAGLATLVSLGTLFDVRHHQQTTYLHTWLYTANLRQPPDVIFKGRLAIWQTAALMVEERPAFGIGVGRILRLFTNYHARVGGMPDGIHLSAHNTFLNFAAELGLVGLSAWLLLLGTIGVTAVRALRARSAVGDASSVWLVLGVTSGLAAYLLTMATGDRNVLREDMAMLGALAALVSLAAPLASAAARRRWMVFGLAALLVLAATVPVRVARERQTIRLDRIESGLYGPEVSRGKTFRWTTGRARFYKTADLRELSLSLRAVASFPQTVSVRLDEQEIDRFTLSDHAWREVRYQLPPAKPGTRYRHIELLVTPTWSPPDDPRELGVQIGW